MKTIGIASDHAGYEMKEFLVGYLDSLGYDVHDFGTYTAESVDYPDYMHPLGFAVERGEVTCGIGLCGSGEGASMTLNKHQGIRAALCWLPEIAVMSRKHNDANVLTLPARYIDNTTATQIVDSFLNTEFEGGRHIARIEKIPVQAWCDMQEVE